MTEKLAPVDFYNSLSICASCDEDDPIDTTYFDATEDETGWYLTVVLDCESNHDCSDLITDDGPYKTYERAIEQAVDASLDWFYENEYGPEHLEFDTRLKPYLNKTQQELFFSPVFTERYLY